MNQTYIQQLNLLHECGNNLAHAAEIGDIESAITHLDDGNRIATEIQAAWRKWIEPREYPKPSSKIKEIYRGPLPGDKYYEDETAREY